MVLLCIRMSLLVLFYFLYFKMFEHLLPKSVCIVIISIMYGNIPITSHFYITTGEGYKCRRNGTGTFNIVRLFFALDCWSLANNSYYYLWIFQFGVYY